MIPRVGAQGKKEKPKFSVSVSWRLCTPQGSQAAVCGLVCNAQRGSMGVASQGALSSSMLPLRASQSHRWAGESVANAPNGCRTDPKKCRLVLRFRSQMMVEVTK